ncbi:MAG TPA: PKD domain-containing protein [Thermoplasmata archaeon]|nr:PKD domain-containing protein [Thermoplasmata archaeon]
MSTREHRGFAAALVLLALVVSAVAFLPATARAQSNQVTGVVYVCGGPTSVVVSGAQVVLTDADGILPPLTATSGSDGVFTFTPPTSNYTLSATRSGYYPSATSAPFRFDGSITWTQNVCMDAQPTATISPTFQVRNSVPAPVGGATLSVYNTARLITSAPALVFTNTTNATTGNSLASLWSDTFEVRVFANGYAPFVQNMTISSSSPITITLTQQITVTGHARNAAGQFVSAGLVGWLYNANRAIYNGTKVIKAVVSGSLFTFNAPPGPYEMIIAANGYASYELPLNLVSGTYSEDAPLTVASPEQYLTTVLFGTQDWNDFTVYRNLTLNAYSSLPTLGPSGLRNLRYQISYTLGDTSGVLGASDLTSFTDWLLANGPAYVTTDSFLLVNGLAYNSTVTSYSVAVSNTLLTTGAKVWINTTTTYHVKSSATITYGQPKYYLNLTLFPDTNTTVYHNETYIVQLPRAYEMASDTILPSTTPPAITTSSYTRITVDPGLVGAGISPQIRMVIQQSLNGTARAKVLGPTGKFTVVNATYQNYRAYVAENTNLTFSAAESTDPIGDITKANFTWRFESNVTTTAYLGYGIEPTFTYTTMGEYVVNLTVVQAGGNVTYRNIVLWVDGTPPVADFKTNRTGSGSANGTSIQFDQGTVVKFDGSLSSDQAYPGKAGVIPNSGYAWDFNGDNITDATGQVTSWTFNTPGRFNVTLKATDGVGWKSANATMTVTVNDTQAPVPRFVILDPANDYAPTSTLTEGRNYTFNASTTTDNYDKLASLNFTWTIPGPIYLRTGNNNTFWGENITIGWSLFNNSYMVKLAVKDTGFGSGKPNTGYVFDNVTVQVDWSRHPDLYINPGTAKVDNSQPESGATITITLNVTNKPNRGQASQVTVSVSESGTSLSPSWTMVDANGNALPSQVIASGSTVTLRITVTVVGQGNKTLGVTVWDQNEPYTVRTSENSATLYIVVNQPAWVNYAIVGAIVGVFLVVIFAMYYRRKVKAGDWQPMRLRRGEKGGKAEGGKEKPRKQKEAKEEKKRL